MIHWHTKDYNEDVLVNRNIADCQLCPRKNSHRDGYNRSKEHSYCSPCGYPNPSVPPTHSEAYNAPCCVYAGGQYGMGSISGSVTGEGATSKDRKLLGRFIVQGGSLSDMRRINCSLIWSTESGFA